MVAILVAAAGAGASAGTPAAPEPAYLSHDYSGGNVYSILPPGENELVTGPQLLAFEAGQQRPANSNDQLVKYAGLLYGAPKPTDATLRRYYHRETFGISPGQVVRTEHPSASVPVAIYRDRFDVLRHYGEGTLSAFLGPSCANEQMDHDQLLLTGYTPTERPPGAVPGPPARPGPPRRRAPPSRTRTIRPRPPPSGTRPSATRYLESSTRRPQQCPRMQLPP